jgi:hypothetical protein
MNSPFKFLDAYDRDDKAIFFGRTAEIEDLYRLVFEANLVLVYGQSGTGKTSLIQCGLANRFQPTDWFQVFVRRQDDINSSLNREVRAHAVTEIKPDAPIEEAVRSLYLDHLRPVYLIFDQFEELFILGTPAEQESFIDSVTRLLASNACCKIIISLREEYLAMLHGFEKKVPTLFNKRLRVEPMSMANVRQVITGTTEALGITLEHGDATAQKIIDSLEDPRAGVQLAYLQVYLDRLYRRAAPEGKDGPIIFTDQAVEETGKLGDILEQFLEEQTDAIQKSICASHASIAKEAVQRILEAFVTLEGTKQPISRQDLEKQLPELAPLLDEALKGLENARILRPSDKLLELAHDSLAARIAERRTAERKSLLLHQKLVRDRLAAFAETHTFLNRDELAVIRRELPQLALSDDEADFVRKSNRAARFFRVWQVGRWMILPILIVIATGAYVWASLDTDEAVVRSHNDIEKLSRSVFSQLETVPNTARVRENLLKEAARIHAELDISHGDVDGDRFWRLLYAADASREHGRIDQARQRYHMLVDFAKQTNPDWRSDLLALVKIRILYARMAELEPDPARRRALNLAMLNLLGNALSSSYADFSEDIEGLCKAAGADGPGQPLPEACNPAPQ